MINYNCYFEKKQLEVMHMVLKYDFRFVNGWRRILCVCVG
jgi:hypothetical protein